MVDLDPLFYPENAVAIVGVTAAPIKGATSTLYSLRKMEFPNPVYNVNKNRKKVMFDEEAYPSITDIPKDVKIDYVVIGVPAKDVPDIIMECVQRKVKFVTIFTSGFSELGTEVGKKLEAKAVENAKKQLRIIGPNCLGVFCRESKITLTEILEVTEPEGHIAFISQSGGHMGTFFNIAEHKGFPFNKAVSIGNQCDLTIQDFVEYFGKDEKIKVVSCYIERIEKSFEFLRILKAVSREKPVIFWKGGTTEEGMIAAASHTGSISSSYEIFRSAIIQNGGITTETLDEAADLTLGALFLGKKKIGERVGLLVPGGGSSVEITDAAARAGLKVPEFTNITRQKIQQIIQDVNTNTRNPVDTGVLGLIPKIYGSILSFIADDPNIDVVVFHLVAERYPRMIERIADRRMVKSSMKQVKFASRSSEKPFVCILPDLILTDVNFTQIRKEIIDGLKEAKIPYFPSMTRAGNAITKLIRYQISKSRREQECG